MRIPDDAPRARPRSSSSIGVYDIHSPRVPDSEEMLELLKKACLVINSQQLWVNPDCGLKTRGWPETVAALEKMVRAARLLRAKLEPA